MESVKKWTEVQCLQGTPWGRVRAGVYLIKIGRSVEGNSVKGWAHHVPQLSSTSLSSTSAFLPPPPAASGGLFFRARTDTRNQDTIPCGAQPAITDYGDTSPLGSRGKSWKGGGSQKGIAFYIYRFILYTLWYKTNNGFLCSFFVIYLFRDVAKYFGLWYLFPNKTFLISELLQM